jgi:3-hydroxybutyryl-CoA dehydratase
MLDKMPRGTVCIEDIKIGMKRHLRKVVTDRDIEMFAEASTDHNPVHFDDDYANDTIDRKSTRLNSSHRTRSRMPSSA